MKHKLLKYMHFNQGAEITHVTLFKLAHGYLLQTNTRSKYPRYDPFSASHPKEGRSSGLRIYTGEDDAYTGSETIEVKGDYDKYDICTKNGPSLLLVASDFCKSLGVAETYSPRKKRTEGGL